MEKRPDDDAFALAFFAAVQDEVARLRKRDGLPVGDAPEKARKLRRDADLIRQGVPAGRLESGRLLGRKPGVCDVSCPLDDDSPNVELPRSAVST